jgi:hypothetical protein
MHSEDAYYISLALCGERYKKMIREYIIDNTYWGWNKTKAAPEQAEELNKFVSEFISGCANKLPLMKLNRWLGYIQGCLIVWGVTTVETERDWTRPLFKPLDFNEEENEI